MKSITKKFNTYINKVAAVKGKSEHSGRTYLENLLNEVADDVSNGGANKHKISVDVEHEPRRDKKGRGAPDFKFLLRDTEIGYLENKKVGEDLDKVLRSEQIKKYKTLTDNLIVTDYLRWIWIYEDEVIKDVRLCEKKTLNKTKIQLKEEDCQNVKDLITDFLNKEPQEITNANDLAQRLAKPTRTIKEEIQDKIESELNSKISKLSRLGSLYNSFKENISETIKPEEFADAFAQTLTYSLFLTKLNLDNPNEKLTLENISKYTPQSFALIKEIVGFIEVLEQYGTLKPYIERILHIINHVNARELLHDLRFTGSKEKDPYIYFYEDFLNAYNRKTRFDAGVFYTPEPVVRTIVNNIHQILKSDFKLSDGFADEHVKVLDFACGTGTFLLQVYERILRERRWSKLEKTNLIKNHVLKNIFGFELLIPAYCVSHLKLSQYLREEKYRLEDDERIQVYLTNTLEDRGESSVNPLGGLIPEIVEEGRKAQEIKENKDILVITGNPPYKGESKNNFPHIRNLIRPYFPKDEIKEKNTKWLQDDYVKFIRFAEDKIVKAGRGIVGVITNHSFIDSPTFRAMRKHLMDSFNKIYVIDLHGSIRKKEKSPDGSPDKNVFDIQQGVAISFFVKNDDITDKKIYHLDILGTRQSKFNEIGKLDVKQTTFTPISPVKPYYLFIPQDATLKKEYEKGYSLEDIFIKHGVGICTKRDATAYRNSKEQLKKVLNDFKKLDIDEIKQKYKTEETETRDKKTQYAKDNIITKGIKESYLQPVNYRPFDKRYTYHTNKIRGFLAYPVYETMNHFRGKKNVGLVFMRNEQGTKDYDNVFISDKMIDLHLLSNGGYIAPLHLYDKKSFGKNGSENLEESENFNKKFRDMIKDRFGKKTTPEEILAFIYASLHSRTYREKYLEFLKMDFPRINFNVSKKEFKRLANIGQKLIDAHLMKKIPQSNIGRPGNNGEMNFIISKATHDSVKQRLYFNKTCYFSGVSDEIWEFKIGGHQVLHSYLKSRKGMNISGDLSHVTNIIKVLDFTIKQMDRIDLKKRP